MTQNKQIHIKGKPLFPWQKELFNVYDENPKGAIITVKSPRQRGKTHCIMYLALREAINRPNQTVIILCPTFQICRKQFRETDRCVKKVPGLVKSANSSFFEFEFSNGSIIQYKSAESKNLRGDTANLLIIDEGAFIDMETAMECFNYCNTTNGNIIICSTPTFEDENNLFYRYYKAALDGEKNCFLVDFCSYDTSALMPLEKMELYKNTLPLNIYLNEIMGEFLTTKSQLWDFGKVLRNNVLADNSLVAGIDFATGTNNDETAIAIFNSNHQMVELHHFNDKDASQTIDFIVNILASKPIKKCCIEVNSLGSVYKDLLKRELAKRRINVNLIEMVTTNETKRNYIENMQLEIQNETCTLLDEHKLKIEFTQFVMKKTPSGMITYGNCKDKYHDDIVIAAALGLHCFTTGSYLIR